MEKGETRNRTNPAVLFHTHRIIAPAITCTVYRRMNIRVCNLNYKTCKQALQFCINMYLCVLVNYVYVSLYSDITASIIKSPQRLKLTVVNFLVCLLEPFETSAVSAVVH